ncbi:MAG: hypothetical protein NTV81_03035 [Candidatus Komeilibacteria bacterium]|nr:hypothetical protein [Candidatus Komeilibacteria bacterium]
MAIPTDVLPKSPEAGTSEQPAYFDETRKAKQLKQQQAKGRQQPGQASENDEETEELETEEEPVETAVPEYQPFPLMAETEESEPESDNEEEELAEEEEFEQLERQQAIQLEQAKQLARQQQQASLLQQSAEAEEQEEEVVGAGEQDDLAAQAIEKGSKEYLDLQAKLAPVVLAFDISGASLLAAAYLNFHLLSYTLGFKPGGLKLAKPDLWHWIFLIIVDLGLIGYFILIWVLLDLMVYIAQHPIEARWWAFKAWMGGGVD